MARGPEGAFWGAVRRAWRGHALRIEASHGAVEPGTPDTVLSIGGAGGFIELKVWPDNVTEQQLAWHVDAVERGAYCRVLSLLPDRTVWLDTAESYSETLVTYLLEETYPPGQHLQAALDMIRCDLIGSTGTRRRRIK